jgi:OOP family OmpA-OmpF porin
MKRITYYVALAFIALNGANAQNNKQKVKDTLVERNSNWVVEASAGHIKGVKPYSYGYYSSKPNGYFGQWEPNSYSIGLRYLVGDIFSVKVSGGFDVLENFKNTGSLPFKMQQINMQFQGVVNGVHLFDIDKEMKRWNFLFHGGIQVVAMTSKTPNIIEHDHNYGMTEYNGGLIFGVTPEYRLSKKAAIQLDVTTIHNYRQHFNWDGTYSDAQENLSGNTVSLSLGLSYSLDRDNIHIDWYRKPKADDLKVQDLEKRLQDMETQMNDTDRDGVVDYLDQENNSIAGVAVDTRGRMIDNNKNGVPDELEKAKDGINGVSSTIVSKDEAIKSLVEKGFVNVFYDVNEDYPNVGSTNNVYYIIKFLKTYPEAKAKLMGYADMRGDEKANLNLSHRRAQKLLDIIKSAGIGADRISIEGEGVDRTFTTETKTGLDLARRVSIILE